jgi:hypothetical protein
MKVRELGETIMITARIVTLKKTLLLTLAVCLLVNPAIGRAEEDIDMCRIEVFPCDIKNGELLAIFEDLEGLCRKKFESQCKEYRISLSKQCSDLSEQYNRLQASHQKALSSLLRLRKKKNK